MAEQYRLEMIGVSKSFPGVKALDGINLKVRPGTVHALMGENGAGKSTLIKVLTGVEEFETGEIMIDGCDHAIINRSPQEAQNRGISTVYQEVNLCPNLTVAENLFIGREPRKGGLIDWKTMNKKASKLLQDLDIHADVTQTIDNYSIAIQQMVAIARAVDMSAKVLILDEPTSSLNESDSKALLDLMLEFKKQGMTMIIITHKLNEVAYVADKITVIRDGSTIETMDKRTDEITEDRIIKGMVGRELTDRFPKRKNVKIGDKALEVKNWTVHHQVYSDRKVVDNVSMYVRKGEVLGISGLMGAGRTELAMSIFGRSYGKNISGELYINGKEVKLHTVKEAIEHKIAYVTEDRKGNGLILSNPIRVNTTLANLDGVSAHGVIDRDKEIAVAEEYRQKMRTKCPSVEQNVGNLSGGNQQKVLLAKWMFAGPDVLILDEPTRGIDVGAKYEIYCIINDLVAAGKSVIMISSELPEVLGMSDRIYVMNEGRIVGELDAAEASQEVIMGRILSSSKGE